MKRRPLPRAIAEQLGLPFEEPAPTVVLATPGREINWAADLPTDRAELLLLQIKRDTAVLRGDPKHHGSAPGAQLYYDRIAACRRELLA